MEDNGKIIMNTRQIVQAVSAQLRLEYGSKGFKPSKDILIQQIRKSFEIAKARGLDYKTAEED